MMSWILSAILCLGQGPAGDDLALFAQEIVAGQIPAPDSPLARIATKGPVILALRKKGQRLFSTVAKKPFLLDALMAAVQKARQKGMRFEEIDLWEINFTRDYQEARDADGNFAMDNAHRGVRGIEIRINGKAHYWTPTEAIATNRRPDKWVKMVVRRSAKNSDSLPAIRTFEADSWLVFPQEGRARNIFRGNEVIPVNDVTADTARWLADAMIGWMLSNVDAEGRLVYKYWPSTGKESSANNMIRQFMGTICLGRIAKLPEYAERAAPIAASNLRYNLGKFFFEVGDKGYIEYKGKAKLGAIALAALAIIESPARVEFEEELGRLARMVASLHDEKTGHLASFYKPSQRTDNQNFYPGEAQLLRAFLLAEDSDLAELEDFLQSFRYYRKWHLQPKNRNPAFIPWHTQANYLVHQKTEDPALADFLLTTNDWLVENMLQEQGEVPYTDMIGRYYAPGKKFGPPHASSTGVYLEGLIDAWSLAKQKEDGERQKVYGRAIVLGIRSLMQLAFLDEVDMFYISKKEKVRGGIRTTVYHNEIRVDNVQHGLMGMLKILEKFEPEDYKL